MFLKTKRLIVQLSDIKKNPSEEVLSLSRRSVLFTELFGEPKVILERCQIQEEDPVHVGNKRRRNLESDEEVEEPVYARKNGHKNLESDEEEEDNFDVRQKVKKVLRILESDEEEEDNEINIGKQISRNVKPNEEYMPEKESEGNSSSDVDSEPDHQTPIYSFSYMQRMDWRERITEVESEEDCEKSESSSSDEDFELRSETTEHSSLSDEEKQEDREDSEDDEDSHSGRVIKSSYEKMIEEKQAERLAFLKALEIDEVKAGYHEAVIARKGKRPYVKKQYTKSENGSVLLRKSSRLANSGVTINFSERALFAKIMNKAQKQLPIYQGKYNSDSESSEDSLDDIIFQDESSSDSASSGNSVPDIISQGRTDFRKLTDALKERIKPVERTFRSSRLRNNCAANSINFHEKYLYLKSVIETLEVKEFEHKKIQLQKDEKERKNIIKNSKSRSSERIKKNKC